MRVDGPPTDPNYFSDEYTNSESITYIIVVDQSPEDGNNADSNEEDDTGLLELLMCYETLPDF